LDRPGHADAVVAGGTGDAGHRGPVVVGRDGRIGVVVAVDKIPAVNVVDPAVAVVVDAVARDLIDVGEDVEVGMIGLHAVVHNGHGDGGVAGRARPRFREVRVGVVPGPVLAGVIEMPLTAE